MPLPGYTSTDPVTNSTGTGTALPRDINPIRSDDDVAFAASQLLNQGNVAEGTNLPPQQQGQYRVPIPGGFKVANQSASFGGNIVTLTWTDIDPTVAEISRYNIYALLAYDSNKSHTMVGTSDVSPCVCRVIASQATNVVYFLQPVLSNGLALPVDVCASCTGTLPDPVYFVTVTDPVSGDSVTLGLSNTVPIGGTTRAGLVVHDNTTGKGTSVASGIVVTFNDNGKAMANLGFGGASPGQHGLIEAENGTGAGGLFGGGQHFRADGGTGKITTLVSAVNGTMLSGTDGTTITEISPTNNTIAGWNGLGVFPVLAGFYIGAINGVTSYFPYYQ